MSRLKKVPKARRKSVVAPTGFSATERTADSLGTVSIHLEDGIVFINDDRDMSRLLSCLLIACSVEVKRIVAIDMLQGSMPRDEIVKKVRSLE